MPKVVHLCNLPLPEDHPDHSRITSHPGRWVLNLALAQKANSDVEPLLVTHVPGASGDLKTTLEGIPALFLAAPDRFRSSTFFAFDAWRLRRAVLSLSPDIIHAHGTEDAYALAAMASGKPWILTAQGCFFIINRINPPKALSRERIVQLTEWVALKRVRHIIAKSQYVEDELHAAFPHLQLHRIPNTFDPRLLEIPHLGKTSPTSLVFVGTIVPRKGVHLLREALARLNRSDITLDIYGDRPAAPSEYERRELTSLKALLGDRLRCHGTIPALEVAKAVAGHSILVAPSEEEMFGNQIIESLLVGTPVLVTDETAMAENVRKFGGGTIALQKDSSDLAAKIDAMIENPPKPEDLWQARQRIVEFMGPAIVARAHEEAYALLARNSGVRKL